MKDVSQAREVFVLNTWDFEKEVARLNKKAERIGVPEIKIVNLGKVTRNRVVLTTGGDGEGEVSENRIPLEVTRYSLEIPQIEDRGWIAMARITPVEGDKPFVDALQPGFDITPWQLADVKHCDHCNVVRNRVISYVARNTKSGQTIQLGRKCFEDYVGKDTLAAMEFEAVVVHNLGGDEDGFFPREYGRGVIPVVEVAQCVALAEALYSRGGWINNVRSEYSGEMLVEGTHRIVGGVLNPAMAIRGENRHSDEALKEMRAAQSNREHVAWKAAREIIERMAEFPTNDENEFATALKTISDYTSIPAKKAALAAYMGQFLRNADARARREAKKATMQYRGTVGAREVFENLICRKSISFNTDYGTTFANIFEDADGNELVWKTGTSYNEGETITLKGTVKAHQERNGVKQTVLSRCKELAGRPNQTQYLPLATSRQP